MESVKLKVQVEREELDQLVSDVNKLKNIKIDIDTGNGTKEAANDAKELNSQLKEGQKQGYLFNDVWREFKGMAIAAAIREVTSAFKDALETMKAVDDEMVVIRKVSGASADELARLEEQAYKTASAYGVAADKYLNGVSAFTRAGYREQADDLAELAVKTELVGDVDAQTAQQFLISTDAAYKYNGSIQELSKVLDGANEIDNKYATSIQKIAEGMGIIAPVAAQAHVGVDELAAAIGTITAVTQRSGSESARALRALFLNIIGDTKTEIDEGVTWTTGEIAGLREVLQLYAADVVAAAEATGSVINPMEAIAALAKSYEDGILTEAKLMEMVSDIGGKLRTSQLLALIENMDMYNSMLNDYVNATGSADREVENAMDSWSRKIEIIKNKWAEIIQSYLDTDTIKDILDGVIDLLDALNTDTGKFIITAGGLSAVILLFKGLAGAISASAAASAGFAAVFNPASLAIVGIATIIAALLPVIDDLNVTYDEQADTVKELEQKQKDLTGMGSEYQELKSHIDDLTDAEKNRLAVLEAEIETNKELLEQERQKEFAMFQGSETATYYTGASTGYRGNKVYETDGTRAEHSLKELQDEYYDIVNRFNEGTISAEEYNSELNELTKSHKDHYEQLKKYEDLDLEQPQRDFIDLYELASNSFDTDGITSKAKLWENALNDLSEANEKFVENGKLTEEGLKNIKEKFSDVSGIDDYIDKIRDAGTNSKETEAILQDLIQAKVDATYTTEELANANYDEIDSFLEGLDVKDHAAEATRLITEANQQLEQEIIDGIIPVLQAEANQEGLTEGEARALQQAIADLSNQNLDVSQKISALAALASECDAVRDAAYEAVQALAELAGQSVTTEQIDATVTAYGKEQDLSMATGGKTSGEYRKQVLTQYAEDYTRIINNKGASTSDTATTTPVTKAGGGGGGGGGGGKGSGGGSGSTSTGTGTKKVYKYDDDGNLISVTETPYSGGSSSSGGSYGGTLKIGTSSRSSSSSSESTEDKQLEALKDIVSLRKSELDLMEARGDSEEDQIEKTKEIQKALENEIAYLKKTGGEQEEINRLCTEWWNLLDDIYDLQIDALEKQRDEEVSVIEKQKDALEEARDAEKDRLDYEEKILAVEEAEAALLNAQNERTVRYYNAETGQWEWGANAQNVASAQKDLENAQKDLEDYLKDAEIEALEKQIKEIEKRYDEEILALEEQRKAETAGYDTAEYTEPEKEKTYGFRDIFGYDSSKERTKNSVGKIILSENGTGYNYQGTKVIQSNDNRIYINGIEVGYDEREWTINELADLAKRI